MLLDILVRIYRESEDGEMVFPEQILTIPQFRCLRCLQLSQTSSHKYEIWPAPLRKNLV